MSARELVAQILVRKMHEAFRRGDLTDAQNIEAFLRSLEAMDDQTYADRAAAAAEASDCLPA